MTDGPFTRTFEGLDGNGKKKFTEGDATQSAQGRARGLEPGYGYYSAFPMGLYIPNPLNIPEWGNRARDVFLRNIVRNGTIFSAVVYGESTRVMNADYSITSENREKDDLVKYQDMLQTCDFGNGFDTFRSKVAQDLLTQDNGAFIELIGDNRDTETPLTGEVKSFAHIDAGQCWRTFSPEWPIIYIDPFFGTQRIFHWTRVVMMSSMPQAYEMGRGMGLCAMSRAYEVGRTVLATNQYIYEKVTGGAPSLYIANAPLQGVQDAVLTSIMENQAKDFQVFRDPIFIAPKSGGAGSTELKVSVFDFKNMPDGFDHEMEVSIGWYMVAAGFGVDAREYWPATSSGATKADAEVQDIKGESKGRAEILNLIENAMNWRIFPSDVTLEFRRRNALTDKHEAENKLIRVQARSTQILSGELTVDEARRMAAAENDIDPAFLEEQEFADDTTDADAVEQTGDEGGEDSESTSDPTLDEEQDAAKMVILATKDYGSIRGQFSTRLFTVINSLRRGRFTSSEFFRDASYLVESFGQRAFLQGIRDGGAAGIASLGELEQDERAAMQNAINDQLLYVSNLTSAFQDSDAGYAQIRERVSLWANKGLDGIYYAGVLAGRENPNMIWEIGATEAHCQDCLNYNGRVYRKKTWAKYGIAPRSSELGCKGYRCDCSLSVTDMPLTPGRPPAIRGKAHEQ